MASSPTSRISLRIMPGGIMRKSLLSCCGDTAFLTIRRTCWVRPGPSLLTQRFSVCVRTGSSLRDLNSVCAAYPAPRRWAKVARPSGTLVAHYLFITTPIPNSRNCPSATGVELRHGLTNSEAASILGISRNHLHALLSRARDQLETSLGVLVLARAGCQDCPVLDSMLEGWDDRLTILLRKRVNQHVRRCLVCSERWQREMTPAMLLGMTPIVALPLAAALSPGFRDLVMRAATGNSPAAVAHRAALARTASAFSSRGFPRPLAPPRAHWRRLRPAHAGALTATAVAAASVVTVVALPPHHAAPPPRGAAIVAGPTASGPSTVGHAASWPPSDVPAASGTGGTERVSAATTGGSASSSATAVTSTSAPASATVSATSASGTLSVRPATLDVTPSATGTITLTAYGGPVDWAVSEPPGLTKKVVVSPMSGTLAADATSTVSVAVDGPGKMHAPLAFSPGGTTVTVVVS